MKITAGGTERTPPATLKFKRANEKNLVLFCYKIFPTPHFRNPYITKMANQLGKNLLVTLANRDTFPIFLEFPM
jgi:hypothetical protein